jgi:hypothetical protein
MNRFLRPLFICAFVVTSAWTATANTVALEFNPAQSQLLSSTPAAMTFGWSFTTTATFRVSALDAFDPESGSGEVWLYDTSGNILASATLSLLDPVVDGPVGFHSQTIPWVTLSAGQTYYIAENYDTFVSLAHFYGAAGGLTTAPEITYGGGVSANGLNQKPTSDLFGGGCVKRFV